VQETILCSAALRAERTEVWSRDPRKKERYENKWADGWKGLRQKKKKSGDVQQAGRRRGKRKAEKKYRERGTMWWMIAMIYNAWREKRNERCDVRWDMKWMSGVGLSPGEGDSSKKKNQRSEGMLMVDVTTRKEKRKKIASVNFLGS
jgi:hypothetical protein